MITATIIKLSILLVICVGFTAASLKAYGEAYESGKNRDSAGIAAMLFFFFSIKLLFDLIDLAFIG